MCAFCKIARESADKKNNTLEFSELGSLEAVRATKPSFTFDVPVFSVIEGKQSHDYKCINGISEWR